MLSFEARAKYDAWAKLAGMTKEEAMQGYIDLMGDPDVWEKHELLGQYDPATFSLA
jgi:acyl-CoA-binding protein